MKYGVVCTNYNNTHFTEGLVRSLSGVGGEPRRIVVVDNNSAPAAVEQLRVLENQSAVLDVVYHPENSGYFPGLNIGIRKLREAEPDLDFIVIGNNDLEFPADFAARLTENLERWREFPVVAPDIVTLNGDHQNPHVISHISPLRQHVWDLYYSNYEISKLILLAAKWSRRATDRRDEDQHATARFIHQGYGACYILTKAFFATNDELWAPSFMYGEEYFLSRQLENQGRQVYYDPRIQVTHRCNGAVVNVPSRKLWVMARDSHRIYRRYVKP